MQGFTYTQLNQALQDWSDNSSDEVGEFVDNIPRIVQLAELRLVKDLNLEIFDVVDTAAVVSISSRLVTKPADLIVARELWLITAGVRSPLLERSYAFLMNYAPNPATVGTPKYYAEYSDTYWYLSPTPTLAATIESRGVYRPESIVEAESTWLGDHCGDLLFAASLMEAEQFIKADDRYVDMRTKYLQELLPTARLELRDLIRAGMYAPYRPAAKEAG